jgi:pimeloyl-ACP methyl ester carboxylesterase
MKIVFAAAIFLISNLLFATECPVEGEKDKYLDTPIDFENPQAGSYKLHYKLHNSFNPDKRTLILLHGGPGEGLSGFDSCSGGFCFHQFGDQYNVIAVDERGAGCSQPPKESHQKFTTIRATADDIEFLKRHLVGEEGKISIFGISFGTVVGTVMASRHPDSVERLILEGSLVDNSYQVNLPSTVDTVLDLFYAERPAAKLLNDEVEQKAKNSQLEISLKELQEMRDAFAMYSYQLLWIVYPMMLEEINNNTYDLYNRLLAAFSVVGDIINMPAYSYIMCREIVDFTAAANRFTTGVQELCQDFKQENPRWPKWNALDFTAEITTPTLIVTGVSDAVTAPYNGETLHESINDSAFFVVPFAGHGVFHEHPDCDLALISNFLDNGVTDQLDEVFNSDVCQQL